jgi:hypothetical protein
MVDTQQLENALNADQSAQEKSQTVLALQSALLSEALERNDGGNQYRDYFWDYAEVTANVVMNAAIQDGKTDWQFICDLLSAYPADGDHHIHTQLVHGIGIGILNAQTTNRLETAASEGFEYLYQTGVHETEVPWEDAFCITWYLDHPEIDVIDRLHEFANEQDPPTFVSGAIKLAPVVNTGKAVDLFIELDQDGLIDPGPTLLSLDKGIHGTPPKRPRYFDYTAQYGITGTTSSEAINKLVRYLQDNWREGFLRHLNTSTTTDLVNAEHR